MDYLFVNNTYERALINVKLQEGHDTVLPRFMRMHSMGCRAFSGAHRAKSNCLKSCDEFKGLARASPAELLGSLKRFADLRASRRPINVALVILSKIKAPHASGLAVRHSR